MSEPKKHTGGCHCGAVRYEVTADFTSVITCNCSICQKTGSMLSFVPAENFTLLSGEDNLTDYQFNKNVIHHLFCKTCGVRSFSRGTGPNGEAMAAINIRCIDDINLKDFSPFEYDGRSQ